MGAPGCTQPDLPSAAPASTDPAPRPPERLAGQATPARAASPARVGSTPAPAPRPAQHPAGSPYPARSHGYDPSYPQCVDPHFPVSAAFAIVGVNGGKAFTRNECAGQQWRSAIPDDRRAVYLNSGYNPDNERFVDGPCRRRGEALRAAPEERTAYAIGCAEASHSLRVMAEAGIARPLVCWVDVERYNSWDEVNLDLNRFALQGLFDLLAGRGCRVGVYSTYAEWEEITGNWRTAAVAGNWVALARPDEACGGRGFSGAPVWLVQELATWRQADYDSNWAC